MKHEVIIEQTQKMSVIVDADSNDDALQEARRMFFNQEVQFSENKLPELKFKVEITKEDLERIIYLNIGEGKYLKATAINAHASVPSPKIPIEVAICMTDVEVRGTSINYRLGEGKLYSITDIPEDGEIWIYIEGRRQYEQI